MRLTEELGFPAVESRALTRAVDEALANIIRHAYDGLPGQPIELVCRRICSRVDGKQRTGLEIVLVDRGVCPDRKKLCGRSLDDIRPGGLGLHFIQGGVDSTEIYKTLQDEPPSPCKVPAHRRSEGLRAPKENERCKS